MIESYSISLTQQQALKHLTEGQYGKACDLYRQAIEIDPNIISNYWYLGLSLLLQGQEVEAQVTWLLALGEANEEQVEQWTDELIEILETEATRWEQTEENARAWVIRQHIREISPNDISNLLKLVQLSLKVGMFSGENLVDWRLIELLESLPKTKVDDSLLIQVLLTLLDEVPLEPVLIELVKACLPYVEEPKVFAQNLIPICLKISQNFRQPSIAVELVELSLLLVPENPEIWCHLSGYCQDKQDYNRGIEAANKAYSLYKNLPGKIFSNYLGIRGLMGAG